MKTMTNAAIILALIFTAACAAPARLMQPGDLIVRAAAGAAARTIRTEEEKTFFGTHYIDKEKDTGTAALGRMEALTLTDDGWKVGGYLDYGQGRFDDLDLDVQHMALGGLARYNLTPALYLEGRLGARNTWMGEESGLGYDAGAAVGVEYRGFFAQVGYDYGTAELGDVDARFDGFGVMIGGVIRL